MGCAKLKPPRRRCPNLKIVILPDFHALHPQSACGWSGNQGSQSEPPRSVTGRSVCCCGRTRAVLSRIHYYTLAIAAPTCPLHDISPIFRRCCGPTRCEPVPRGRRARVSAHIAEGGIETSPMIFRARLCCTSQGAAGGSGMPTPVCSCGDMWCGS